MDRTVPVALIELVPTFVWAGLILAIVLLFRSTIRDQVFPRLSRLKAFGVEVEIAAKAVSRPPGSC